jgi:hypothetical protein
MLVYYLQKSQGCLGGGYLCPAKSGSLSLGKGLAGRARQIALFDAEATPLLREKNQPPLVSRLPGSAEGGGALRGGETFDGD